jgi:Kae1-associated kinase Bud32
MTKLKIIQQGAEAIILQEKNRVIKRRIKKSYRIPEIDDKIRRQRTRSEAKLLTKAFKLISIPEIIKVDQETKEIIMDFIDGKKLSDYLDKFPLKKQKEVCKLIGESTAKLHDADIIHGDLTTSNMILKDNKIYFIDFGLGFISHKFEDKAVDIHLLKQALEAKHFKNWGILFREVLKGYSKSKDSEIVLERLNKVEKRGRYK